MAIEAISLAPANYPNFVEVDRTLVDALGRRTAGVFFDDASALGFKVTPGSGHTFDVAAGRALVREKTSPTIRGGYFVRNTAVYSDALPVPQANPFYATIILRVADPQYGSVTGAVGPRIDVISGTPASTPAATADATIDALTGTPGGWIRLADIRINTADTGAVPGGQFEDKRRPGGFGIINCLSTNLPLAGVSTVGTHAFVLDGSYDIIWNGTAWVGVQAQRFAQDAGFPVAVSITASEGVMSRITIPARPYARNIQMAGYAWTSYSQAAEIEVFGYYGALVAARTRRTPAAGIPDTMHINSTTIPLAANTALVLEMRLSRLAGTGTVTSSISGGLTSFTAEAVPA